jgi:hypothetical protein
MGLRPTEVDENGAEEKMTKERNGRGQNRSGDVEAVREFGPGRVFEPILATFPVRRGRAMSA